MKPTFPAGGGLLPHYFVYTGSRPGPRLPQRWGEASFTELTEPVTPSSSASGLVLAVPWPGSEPDLPLWALTPAAAVAHPRAQPLYRDAADPALILAALLALLGVQAPAPEPAVRLALRLKAHAPAVAVVGSGLGALTRALSRAGVRLKAPEDTGVPLVAFVPPHEVAHTLGERPFVSLWPLQAQSVPLLRRGAQILYGGEDATVRQRFADWILFPDSPQRVLAGLRQLARGREPRHGRETG
jgi:hypothetical protein